MAAYEVLLLNTAIPQIQAAQSGDTYVVPRDIAINATAIISANSATDALRITQTGAGNAILVEDSANPDSTPFVVTGAGDVGIGTSSPGAKLDVLGASADQIRVRTAATEFYRFGRNASTGFLDFYGSQTGYQGYTFGGVDGTWATINASGNLGLGVTPSAWGRVGFEIGVVGAALTRDVRDLVLLSNAYWASGGLTYAASAAAGRFDVGVAGFKWYTAPSGTAGNAITFTQVMTLDASGNLGVGQTNPLERLTVNGGSNTTSAIRLQNQGTNVGYMSTFAAFSGSGSSNDFTVASIGALNLVFGANGTERARITSGGVFNVGLGSASVTTTQGIQLNPADGYFANNSTTGGDISLILLYSSYSVANETKFEVTSAGNVKSRTNSYAGFSDARLKQNITSASTQWNDIKNIEVVKFQMKSEQFSDENNPWMLGVIAQQVEAVSPGLVEEDPKDGMKTVKYSILYMKAVKALQEAMARIEQLEAKVAAMGA